ncbi:MAG TPA: hypothetical protein DCP32_07000 [Anaerolineaceae bacterium]|nr:MAG: hypothetical protein A2X24_07425 [Chloroflexi bacterium GWB2_54_36]HAL16492.1 hypothetical protein [Anaerolineaceae bacterium]HBA92918.1 hypothetical protein [Anaerolineaceae bacterium]
MKIRDELKFPYIKDSNLVCYLILELGIPSKTSRTDSPEELETMVSARKAGKSLGINITSIQLSWGKSKMANSYLFHFPNYERNDEQAKLIGETFLHAISFIWGPHFEGYSPSIFRIPKQLVHGKRFIEGEKLVQLEESREYNERTFSYPALQFRVGAIISPWYYDYAWKIMPILIQNQSLRRAIRYMCISQDNFYIFPGETQEVLDNFEDIARSDTERSKFEVALQNAFRTVEAVIGDPPKEDIKLHAKISAVGLDPSKLGGYKQKRSLAQTIRNMCDARDKKSAHGSTPMKDIAIGELFEYQDCAHYIVSTALENELKKKSI